MPLGLVGGAVALGVGASVGTAAAVGLAGAAIGATVIGGIEANKQSGIASTQEGMAQTTFGEQQGFEQQLQALIANPSSVKSLPGYAFNLDQGASTVGREMGASGFFGSGNEAAALTQYGQGYASSAYQQQVQLLSQLSGITAPSSPAQSGSVASGAQNSTASQLNNLFANLGIMGGLTYGKYGAAGGSGSPNFGSTGGANPMSQ